MNEGLCRAPRVQGALIDHLEEASNPQSGIKSLLCQVFDVYWRSLETGSLWYKSGQLVLKIWPPLGSLPRVLGALVDHLERASNPQGLRPGKWAISIVLL